MRLSPTPLPRHPRLLYTAPEPHTRAPMQHVLIVFNILFFATGFMGVTALALLKLSLHSRLLGPLLDFHSLFLAGMGFIVVYSYLAAIPECVSATTVLVHRIVPPRTRKRFRMIVKLIRPWGRKKRKNRGGNRTSSHERTRIVDVRKVFEA